MKKIRQELVDKFRQEIGQDVFETMFDRHDDNMPDWLRERVDNFCRPRIERMCANFSADVIRSLTGL